MPQLSTEQRNAHVAGQKEIEAVGHFLPNFMEGHKFQPLTLDYFDSMSDGGLPSIVLPPSLQQVFDYFDGAENGDVLKSQFLTGLNKGIQAYQANNGGQMPSDMAIASALSVGAGLLAFNDENKFEHFDSLSADHHESLSAVANIAIVSMATMLFNSLPMLSMLPNPIGSTEVPLINSRFKANMNAGAFTSDDYLDGAKACLNYLESRRKYAMSNGGSGNIYTVTPRLAYSDYAARTPDTGSPVMPFVGGRVSVRVNGKEVAHDRSRDHGTKVGTHSLIPVQNVTIGSGNTPVLVSAGTVNLSTHTVSVTFSAALPVGAVVTVVVLADYERKDSNGNYILTPPGAEIDLEYASLYADAMRIQVSATQDAAQQMAAELGISFNAAALGILQNKFYLERNIRLLEDAKERAEANDSVVQFDAQRGVTTGATAAFNDTGEMMQEMSTALDKGKLMIANKVGGSSAGYDFFVTDNAAILISHISGDRFIRTGSQIGTDTAIVLIGRFNDGTNVYYVPKSSGLFEETGSTSEGLLLPRSADPIKAPFVGFTVTPPIMREALANPFERTVGVWAKEGADLNPLSRYSDQAVLIELTNLPHDL